MLITILDVLAMLTAIVASILWWQASRSTLRRVGKSEDLDHQDFNRLIVAYNRSQIFNSRAALATAASALCVALRFGAQLLGL
jgi:hypothetical protein